MNTETKNKEEFLLYALMVSIFTFVLATLNTNQNSEFHNSGNQKYIITELSEVAHSAILSSVPVVPDFNLSWITSNCSILNQNLEFALFTINNRFKTEQKCCSENYLNIKPTCLTVFITYKYSSNEYSEIPSLA